MAVKLEPSQRINLKQTNVLLLDGNAQALDAMRRTLSGFGVSQLRTCDTVAGARSAVEAQSFHLVIADPLVSDEDGFEFLRWIRRHASVNKCVPVIAALGHGTLGNIQAARDAGANFVVAKPVSPQVLLQRIEWIARENRQFIEAPNYVGPDRRFKNVGPPAGSRGRRADDLSTEVPSAAEPNMSQFEVDELLKPRKVVL